MGKHPNPKPQTTRIQDPTKLLVGEGERGKQRSQDPQMGTSLASPPHELVQEWYQSAADSVQDSWPNLVITMLCFGLGKPEKLLPEATGRCKRLD